MATEEESDTPEPESQSSSGLKELFSMGEEGDEADEESSDTQPGETDSGEEAESPGEATGYDDAEILSESDEAGPEAATPSEDGGAATASTEDTGPSPDATDTAVGEEQMNDSSTTTDSPGPTVEGDAEIISERTKPERPEPEAGNGDEESVKRAATNRLTTGISMLDRELEGGIPPGRMLSLVAPPETQSELIVKEMAVSRPTVYISTFRPEWEVREELHDHLQKTDDERLIGNDLDVSYVHPERLLADPMEYIGDLPKGSNLIIDSINEFELEDRRRYVEFLNNVKEVLWDTGSVGMFYGIEEASDPPARSLTLKRSDLVWQLDRSIKANEIQTELIISKFRGGKALTEPVKLVLTDDVQVDMSRDIG